MKITFNFLDTYVWEPLQRRFPILTKLDNAPWKTWIWHAVICVAFGHALALLPFITAPIGMWAMVGFYIGREVYNIVEEDNRNFWDAFLDVWVPLVVVLTVIGVFYA